jgi:hypothetical protein
MRRVSDHGKRIGVAFVKKACTIQANMQSIEMGTPTNGTALPVIRRSPVYRSLERSSRRTILSMFSACFSAIAKSQYTSL